MLSWMLLFHIIIWFICDVDLLTQYETCKFAVSSQCRWYKRQRIECGRQYLTFESCDSLTTVVGICHSDHLIHSLTCM